jgi:excisionase family DNA binding protein
VGVPALGMTERCKTQLADPEQFARRLDELAAMRHPVHELVQFADGRVFELDYQPITHAIDGFVGHVWKYRAVHDTDRRKPRRTIRQATATPSVETAMTSEDAMAYLKVSKRTLYRLIDREGLPTLRVGRQFRFRRSEIDGWLATRGGGIAN